MQVIAVLRVTSRRSMTRWGKAGGSHRRRSSCAAPVSWKANRPRRSCAVPPMTAMTCALPGARRQPGDRVGQPRAGGREHDLRLPGGEAALGGHEAGSAFVAGVDDPQPGLRRRRGEPADGRTADAEGMLASQAPEPFSQSTDQRGCAWRVHFTSLRSRSKRHSRPLRTERSSNSGPRSHTCALWAPICAGTLPVSFKGRF